MKINKEILLEKEGIDNMATVHIAYHSEDIDGHCSGAICRYFEEEFVGHSNIIMIPSNYNMKNDWIKNVKKFDYVYIVDFSIKPHEMDKIIDKATVVWYDHHQSAINDYKNYDKLDKILGERRTDMSALLITYNNLLREKLVLKNYEKYNVNKTLELLSDFDNWNIKKYKDEDDYMLKAQTINMFVDSFNNCPSDDEGYSFWKKLFNKGLIKGKYTVKESQQIGTFILNYKKNFDIYDMFQKSFTVTMPAKYTNGQGKLRVLCFNNSKGSLSFKSVYDPSKHDIMMSFVRLKNNYGISFYSKKNNIDVSKIAKIFGGGGHKGASGCSVSDIIFKENTVQFIK